VRLPGSKSQRHIWLHTSLAIVWAFLLIPTLIWWPDSVLWVATMSLYANVVGHWSARQAAIAESEAESD
jgi:hypothetical protein